ncbi:MAG: DUF885 domain-containing protein [Acidothermus sp.]|nr:DUF885 domain-containing protein [Acidothermus sp.]MCL6537540.1 DUF885 domain-containing protein [Acidothermus sp.]
MTGDQIRDRCAAFERLARAVIDDMLERQPSLATALGDHRFDDRLEDLRPEAVAEEVGILRRHLRDLAALELSELPADYRVDAEILRNKVTERLFELEVLREHTWNPLASNPGTSLYLLLARDFAPRDERLRSLARRLQAVPERLADARRALGTMPQIHVETAIDQFTGTLHLVTEEIPARMSDSLAAKGVRDALPAAAEALRDHLKWLSEQYEYADRNPRLGRELFAAKLALVLDVQRSPEQVLTSALQEVEEIEERLQVVASQLGGSPRDVFDQLAAEAPNDETIVDEARAALAEATEYVTTHDLVTVHADPLEIIVMPEIHRGVAVAYCDPPGPLDPPNTPTFFAIAPTPSSWSPERVASFYREYNRHALRNLVVHEAMPGHMLQLAHARRAPTPTIVRRAFWSGPFVEGWAVFAEEFMVRHGFGGPAVAMQQLKMRLRSALNAVLDVRVHCDDLSEAEAMRLMRHKGYQEEGEAVGKWRRALLTSTQLSTYHVGATEVAGCAARIRAQRPTWSIREVHDALLAHGSPPPRHLPALLGVD